MNRALVDRIADAVLYEGYLLYPYRPSVKNRQRWTFGGLYPPAYCEAQSGSEPSRSQTECLVLGGSGTRLSVRVRFLQLQQRRTATEVGPAERRHDMLAPAVWDEAVEREVGPFEASLDALIALPVERDFALPARRDEQGGVVREQSPLAGAVVVSAMKVADVMARICVVVENRTAIGPEEREVSRDDASRRALVSTHAILEVEGGEFVSLLDPPEPWREAAGACRNEGTWPVLVGEPGERTTLLSSPIILYDYPEVAPESPGDLFDSTEIDEILTLRILTLTDDEKRAMAAVDDRARALLERTEAIDPHDLMRLHGTLRNPRAL
jgi:hydrogenase maturation protease